MKQTDMSRKILEQARERLDQAVEIAALTGAGISAESGVPTFRGADGLWRQHRMEDLATPEAFQRDPRLVWTWYNWRRALIADKTPNPGHLALARLERLKPAFQLITQNVDGLHQLAGSRNLLEIHGSIWRVRCTVCGQRRIERNTLANPPSCPACQGLLRPDVVWFGEALATDRLDAAFRAVSQAEVLLVVGTSGLVQPAASLAWQAKRSGAWILEINIEPTPFSEHADAVLPGPAGRILPQLLP